MKRPLILAAEFAAAMLIASVAGWVANRFNHKKNRDSQTLERIAAALEAPAPEKHYLAANIRIVEPPAPGPDPDPCDQIRFTARRK